MDDKLKKYLHDILHCILSIEEHTVQVKSFAMYHQSKMVKRAVERELEIIGEAVNRIQKLNPSVSLTNSKNIIGLRNFIIHAYDSIDDNQIWAIIKTHLPQLKSEVQKMLNE